jgi:hypothetical protein
VEREGGGQRLLEVLGQHQTGADHARHHRNCTTHGMSQAAFKRRSEVVCVRFARTEERSRGHENEAIHNGVALLVLQHLNGVVFAKHRPLQQRTDHTRFDEREEQRRRRRRGGVTHAVCFENVEDRERCIHLTHATETRVLELCTPQRQQIQHCMHQQRTVQRQLQVPACKTINRYKRVLPLAQARGRRTQSCKNIRHAGPAPPALLGTEEEDAEPEKEDEEDAPDEDADEEEEESEEGSEAAAEGEALGGTFQKFAYLEEPAAAGGGAVTHAGSKDASYATPPIDK